MSNDQHVRVIVAIGDQYRDGQALLDIDYPELIEAYAKGIAVQALADHNTVQQGER